MELTYPLAIGPFAAHLVSLALAAHARDLPAIHVTCGYAACARILESTSEADRVSFLEFLKEECPEVLEGVKKHLLEFADIRRLSERDIQQVIREVDARELALALATADKAELDCIQRNVSKRAWANLEEDIGYQATARTEDSLEARRRIVRVMSKLIVSGDIVLDKEQVPVAQDSSNPRPKEPRANETKGDNHE